MKILIVSLLFATAMTQALGKANPLPQAEVIQSQNATASDAIRRMYVSADFVVPTELKDRLVSQADPVQIQVDAIKELIRHPAPAKSKLIQLVVYTLGDPRLTAVIKEAFKAGIKVEVTTDLNADMDGKFADENERFNSDFKGAGYKKETGGKLSVGAQAISEFLGVGMKFGEQIISQPLYNVKYKGGKNVRVPIQHEKHLRLKITNVMEKLFSGTANAAPHQRYNRVLEIEDPELIKIYADHIEVLNANYRAGRETRSITDNVHRTLVYRDGSSIDLAFTDGQFNPNDRIAAAINENAAGMVEVYKAIFADTFRDELEAYRKMLDANSSVELTFLADEKFAHLTEWGIIAAAVGFDVQPPFGKTVFGFSRNVVDRVNGYVYLRPATDDHGVPETEDAADMDGAPVKRWLMHDKTTLLIYTKDGKTFAKLYTGSFNSSNNVVNADGQLEISVPGDSWLVAGTKLSMTEVIKNEPQFALPAPVGIVKWLVSELFGRSPLSIMNEAIETFLDSALGRDVAGMKKALSAIYTNGDDHEAIQLRIDKTIQFFDWYVKNLKFSGDIEKFRVRRWMEILLITSGTMKGNDWFKAHLIRQIIWRANISDDELHAKMVEAAKVLDLAIDDKFLTDEVRSAPDVAPEVAEAVAKKRLPPPSAKACAA